MTICAVVAVAGGCRIHPNELRRHAAAGFAPANPAWLAYGGAILLFGVTPLTVYGILRMWRRCLLRITPSTLIVRLAERGSELTEIRRELVESIEPRLTPQPVSGYWLQVAIT